MNTSSLGCILALILCMLSACEAWHFRFKLTNSTTNHVVKLRLVNLFNRHGDRSPSDGVPPNDRHLEAIKFFWPNGLTNLTEIGYYREFKIGLKIRELYRDFLKFELNEVLALTSSVQRCIDSLRQTLKGLFNIEQSRYESVDLLMRIQEDPSCSIEDISSCPLLARDSPGSAEQWKLIHLDQNLVPSLDYNYVENCPITVKNPSIYDSNVLLDPNINRLSGLRSLQEIMQDRYNLPLNYSVQNIWSTVLCELNIIRTQRTFPYTSHFIDWYNLPATESGIIYSSSANDTLQEFNKRAKSTQITLFNLLEAVTLIVNVDRLAGNKDLLQVGPMLTSLIDSQLIAMGREDELTDPNLAKANYRDKKMIIYSTHDTVLTKFLASLGFLNMDGTFEGRFEKYHNSEDYLQWLNYIRMPAFGVSVKFELLEAEYVKDEKDKEPVKSFFYVQMSIYNSEDIVITPIDYHPIELGTLCSEQFNYNYPDGRISDFYDDNLNIDKRYACPFNLFKNLTSRYLITKNRTEQLCNSTTSN